MTGLSRSTFAARLAQDSARLHAPSREVRASYWEGVIQGIAFGFAAGVLATVAVILGWA